MIDDEYIKEYFWSNKQHAIIYNRLKTTNDNIKDYLLNRYNDSDTLKESLYRIFNNIEIRPKCEICNKTLQFNNGFKHTCSSECAHKLTLLKRKQTWIDKYGYDSPMKSNIVKEKQKQTNLIKYGVTTNLQIPECVIKAHSEKANEKRNKHCENTCLEKYGKKTYLQTDECKNKSIKTCLQHYGVKHYVESEECKLLANSDESKLKYKHTCLQKYNVDYYVQSEDFKRKAQKTFNKKYGVNWYTNTNDLIKQSHSPESMIKRDMTKLQNHTFNTSIPEEIVYTLLCEKYTNVLRQYKSDLYPFNCDFYIPILDLYIEYNGSHYHNSHPFNANDENDINELNTLKEKALHSERHKQNKKSQYDSIIYVWTELDVKKRNIAKQNKLNFIEFYNINDVKKYLNGL